MTNSTGKVNLFQICSEFLFPFTKGLKPGNEVVSKETSAAFKNIEIVLGKVSNEEIKTFINLWETLITNPDAFPGKISTPISTFLSQESTVMLADRMIRDVISAHLKSANQPYDLTAAVEKCSKIFHEDHPGSFILAYNGKRLGMFILSLGENENEIYSIKYIFNPTITNFKWL